MKKSIVYVLSILLIAALAFSLCACNTDNGDEQGTASPSASAKNTPLPGKTTAKTTTAANTTAPAATATADSTVSSTVSSTAEPTPTPVKDLYPTDYSAVNGKAVIDGEIDDAWNKAEVVELNEVKIDNPDGDTIVKASMMWDKDGFYFLFDITDSAISQTKSKGDYQNDSIYLYISEDLQEETTAFADFIDGTYQFALISSELEMLPRYGFADDVENCTSAYKTTDTGMIIEFFYQPAYAELAVGTQMFMDFQYNDCADGSRLGALGWYNESDENARTELWGVVKLIEAMA